MPVWSPGYYGIADYARSASNFRVEDAAGHPLPFEKTARNTWRVAAGNAPLLVLNYDVFGQTPSRPIRISPMTGLISHRRARSYIWRGRLRKMVTAATQLMGDVPYKHYTFLMAGRGNGGIEHLNSSSDFFNGESLTTDAGYLRWPSFIAHEYFHNFNVKRIRPIALGPFDYEQENLTRVLWVSEGLSACYQDLLLVRAGLMTTQQYPAKMATSTGTFENAAGHHFQSATESSLNTWNSGSGVGGDRNTTISYYNNGAMLGAMLDLKIATRAAAESRSTM